MKCLCIVILLNIAICTLVSKVEQKLIRKLHPLSVPFYRQNMAAMKLSRYTAWTVNVVLLSIVHVDNAGFSEFFPSCLPERNWISESILDNAALLQQYPHMDNAAFSLPRGYPEWMLQYCRGIVQHCLIGFQSQFWTMPHYCSNTPRGIVHMDNATFSLLRPILNECCNITTGIVQHCLQCCRWFSNSARLQ